MLELVANSSASSRIFDFLTRVQYRRADSDQEKEQIFRERYEAYRRDGAISEDPSGMFRDAEDEKPNLWLIGVYIDGELASAIRFHAAWRPEHYLPVTNIFPEIVRPLLEQGRMVIDSSRLITRPDFARAYPFLSLVTMAISHFADDHFDADVMTAACKPEYRAAYRRLGGCVEWAPPRPYPPMVKKIALMGYDCAANRAALRARFPFIETTPETRQALFGRSSTQAVDFQSEWASARAAFWADPRQDATICVA